LLIEKRLQNHRCRNLVDHTAMILPRMTRFVKQLVRFMGGQSLIPKVNRQPGQLAQLAGKGPHLCGLGSRLAAERQRISNYDPRNAKSPAEARNRPQILALVAAPL
jgi:hypothetical protein